MKEHPKMGINRTGVHMSPFDSAEMSDASAMAPTPSDREAPAPDGAALASVRAAYVSAADQLGSVPLPGTLKGAFNTAASVMTGNLPHLFLDKLGERLAFERTGARIYDALIAKVKALQADGASTLPPLEILQRIRDQEASHGLMVAEAMRGLGADPTAQTPCADLAGVESGGIVHAVTDPRTTLAQSLHAVLIAEMADNYGWETLIALAEDQHHPAMAADFASALGHERTHLQQVQAWYEELTLGAPIARKPAAPETGATLH
jgi:hypothetical protein